MSLNDLAREFSQASREKGFEACKPLRFLNDPHDYEQVALLLALLAGEAHEAIQEARSQSKNGICEELADVIIRALDLAGHLQFDIEGEVSRKMEKNKTRPYKHGKIF